MPQSGRVDSGVSSGRISQIVSISLGVTLGLAGVLYLVLRKSRIAKAIFGPDDEESGPLKSPPEAIEAKTQIDLSSAGKYSQEPVREDELPTDSPAKLGIDSLANNAVSEPLHVEEKCVASVPVLCVGNSIVGDQTCPKTLQDEDWESEGTGPFEVPEQSAETTEFIEKPLVGPNVQVIHLESSSIFPSEEDKNSDPVIISESVADVDRSESNEGIEVESPIASKKRMSLDSPVVMDEIPPDSPVPVVESNESDPQSLGEKETDPSDALFGDEEKITPDSIPMLDPQLLMSRRFSTPFGEDVLGALDHSFEKGQVNQRKPSLSVDLEDSLGVELEVLPPLSPTPTNGDGLHDLGYIFEESGKLVHKDSSVPYTFKQTESHVENTHIYDRIARALTHEVLTYLTADPDECVHGCGLLRYDLPNIGFFFGSPNILGFPRLILLIHGSSPISGSGTGSWISGEVRAGIWSKQVVTSDGLHRGSMIPMIRYFQEEGFGVVVLDTNGNPAVTPHLHACNVWKRVVIRSKCQRVGIVAHSFGGVVALTLAKRSPRTFREKVFAVALTDSVHGHLLNQTKPMQDFFSLVGVNWVTSDVPLDTPVIAKYSATDLPKRSAGTSKHEEAPSCAMESIFKFIQEKENEWEEKKARALMQMLLQGSLAREKEAGADEAGYDMVAPARVTKSRKVTFSCDEERYSDEDGPETATSKAPADVVEEEVEEDKGPLHTAAEVVALTVETASATLAVQSEFSSNDESEFETAADDTCLDAANKESAGDVPEVEDVSNGVTVGAEFGDYQGAFESFAFQPKVNLESEASLRSLSPPFLDAEENGLGDLNGPQEAEACFPSVSLTPAAASAGTAKDKKGGLGNIKHKHPPPRMPQAVGARKIPKFTPGASKLKQPPGDRLKKP